MVPNYYFKTKSLVYKVLLFGAKFLPAARPIQLLYSLLQCYRREKFQPSRYMISTTAKVSALFCKYVVYFVTSSKHQTVV